MSSCCNSLFVIRNLKRFAPFNVRKQIAEIFVLSKLYNNDVVYHHLPDYLIRHSQRVQIAASGFVPNPYATMSDVLVLRWLPITLSLI